MKATGIVRRIEEYAIIGPKLSKSAQTLDFREIFKEKFLTKNSTF